VVSHPLDVKLQVKESQTSKVVMHICIPAFCDAVC
jgi:hypothetical protein